MLSKSLLRDENARRATLSKPRLEAKKKKADAKARLGEREARKASDENESEQERGKTSWA